MKKHKPHHQFLYILNNLILWRVHVTCCNVGQNNVFLNLLILQLAGSIRSILKHTFAVNTKI